MSNILLVPVHLDALVLDHDEMVVEATADFSRLPFTAGKRDFNPDIANISEEIVSTPFGNENLKLKKGIHLHWSLPDALTRARHNLETPENQDFPRVPNRWLVTRCNAAGVVEKEWVIESDYLFPTATGNPFGSSVAIPYYKDSGQPFRYMGRSMELTAQGRDTGEYYPKLTAVGYGEPTFAAFYPNCHSVFGFYDADYAGRTDGRQYYVTGWYSNLDQDILTTHVRDVLPIRPSDVTNFASLTVKLRDHTDPLTQYLHSQFSAATQTQLSQHAGSGDPPEALRKLLLDDLNSVLKTGVSLFTPERFAQVTLTPDTMASTRRQGLTEHEAVHLNRVLLEEAFPTEIARRSPRPITILQDSFRWTYVQPTEQQFPFRIVCYARIIMGQGKPMLQHGPTSVAVGNTGTEALSACMAQKMGDEAPKPIVEDHLEALHLAPKLEHLQVDVPAKFYEARHEKSFAAVAGGTIWTVGADSTADSPAVATDARSGITLPKELGRLLNTVNERQADYDRTWQHIESLRVQLFSDWYKYMLCVYPPQGTRDAYPNIDEVKSYIEARTAALNQKIKSAGTLLLNQAGGRVVAAVSPGGTNGAGETLASVLAKAIHDLQAFLDSHRETAYKLKQTSGPRYWRPTEPSILIEGSIADPSNRHGKDGRPRDGLLEAYILPNVNKASDPTEQILRGKIRQQIVELGGRTDKNFAFSTWEGQPWNPFLLEWEVEVFPLEHKSNIDPRTGRYQEDFITANYQLLENDVDLSLKPGRGAWTLAANVYIGRSILTPHATAKLGKQAESYIEKEVLPQYYKETKLLKTAQESDEGFDPVAHIKKVQTWYENRPKPKLLRAAKPGYDPTMTAFRAWRAMRDPDCLSQSLSGFNQSLLMYKQTLQLDIADPLGFKDYQPFASSTSDAVNDSIYCAPEPLNDFNPIRTGMMKVHRLRLVDTFGQIKDIGVRKIVSSEPMDDGTDDPLVVLPPRITQPARVNFRWLSADADQQEMNDHPATTPICGWVLANHLDKSLMIYDNEGKALGSLINNADAKAVEWVTAPGGRGIRGAGEIGNHHLQKMVTTIQKWGVEFFDDFLNAIDSALENIEPENFTQHQDVALLMGRPLALVRASLNLELKGLPATHQGWNEFRQDMQREARDDNGFSRVRFPIRIGEYNQFNDGTVGYWKEKDDGYEDNVFYAPQSDEDVKVKCAHLKTHLTNPDDMVFFQTVEAPPQILSLLIDPRAVVHATTGILPVKGINIPPDQYAAALQDIEITFLSTPIVTDAGKIHLPLPDEAGYQWSWLQQDGQGAWSEVTSRGMVKKESFAEFGSSAEAVWKDLIDRGWIEPEKSDPTRASVKAKDERKSNSLSDNLKDKTNAIEDILDRAHIGPVNPVAKFSGPQEIREGWLKLSAVGRAQR